MEYQINDRLNFKRFLGLSVTEKSPDAKTIWLWRERLKKEDIEQQIFGWFAGELRRHGDAAKGGYSKENLIIGVDRDAASVNAKVSPPARLLPKDVVFGFASGSMRKRYAGWKVSGLTSVDK
ncbi:MAG: transposase [Alphaproteobacteria bacterium]|nr:MAG: transposase [Alphaproteobacteria bacterium]TAF16099.1 MAG: transposase [Alphaproteobacteria bacterium]TAF75893.1 MAG: transposase [Alphaproteobacteria bacterium]